MQESHKLEILEIKQASFQLGYEKSRLELLGDQKTILSATSTEKEMIHQQLEKVIFTNQKL